MKIQIPNNWVPRPYQLPLWSYLENGGKRASCCWHRRAGKDNLSINWIARSMVMRPGLYWHLLPTYKQGRKIVWDGFTKEGRKWLDYFPPQMIKRVRNDEMLIELNPLPGQSAGSIYQVVGTDDIDRLVGTNPIGCVFSEFALHDPAAWRYISPILAENDGWAVFISTFRGKNHFYDLHEAATRSQDWFAETLTVDDTYILKSGKKIPVIAKREIESLRETGMSDVVINQEFYCKPDAGLEGSYYQDLMAKAADRIGPFPHDAQHKVHTAWDLGFNDHNAIWFFQMIGGEIRLIDYHEDKNKALPHYINIINSKDYVYGKHLAPHDIKVTEYSTGMTRLQVAKDLGLKFDVVPKLKIQEGINAVRTILPRCTFNTKSTGKGVDALKSWGREYDEKKKIYRDKPRHDWASHGADAFRTMAVGIKRVLKLDHRGELPSTAIQNYDILSPRQRSALPRTANSNYRFGRR